MQKRFGLTLFAGMAILGGSIVSAIRGCVGRPI